MELDLVLDDATVLTGDDVGSTARKLDLTRP